MADAALPNLYSALQTLTGGRVYLGVAGDDAGRAGFIVWQPIATTPQLTLAGAPTLDRFLYQVDCYSEDPTQARILAFAARDRIEAQTHVIQGPSDRGREADTRLYRWQLEAEYLWSRTNG